MSLYEPTRHEELTDTQWSEERAQAAIDRIVADTHRSFTAEGLWSIHPFDISPERPPGLKPIYYGAAGVIWTLKFLDEVGAAKLERDYLPTVRELIGRHRHDILTHEGVREYMGHELASYLLGELGMLLLLWKLDPSAELAQRIHAGVEEKVGDPRGLAWGGAGSMLVALFMLARTGDLRWRDLFLRHFDAVWDQWKYSDEAGCYLWTHDLYGVSEMRLGALHGFFANAIAMIKGRHLLPLDRRDESMQRIWETLRRTALTEGARANWPNNVGPSTRPKPMPLLLQFCNGAPGVICCMADFPRDSRWPLEELLRHAGEHVWDAGPTIKFPSLCHGASGSGYAFLKLYDRTGDDRWLVRARRFAMHAIDQCDHALEKYGQRKFSLWTGDLGLAVYLSGCLTASAELPTIDNF